MSWQRLEAAVRLRKLYSAKREDFRYALIREAAAIGKLTRHGVPFVID